MAKSPDPPPLLLDTHVWVWQMLATDDLAVASRITIDEAALNGSLRLSAISFWEIALLASRKRLDLGKSSAQWLFESLRAPGPIIEPLSPEIAVESCHLPGGFRSDPADQIIVATARVTGANLMTRDGRILAYAMKGYLAAIAA
jgi:PIN domain nuclease of toxin-antitoxin system